MQQLVGSRHLAIGFSVLVGFAAGVAAYLGSVAAIMYADLEVLLSKDGADSGLSTALVIASLMLGWRVGVALWEGSFRAGLSLNDRIGFRAWLIGILAFGLVSGVTNALVARMESWGEALLFTVIHFVTLLVLVATMSHLLARWKARQTNEADETHKWGERR